ncbi:RNA methyltransferase, TrmH family [Oryzisolibacter propanilivorax]|uniref:RNA methyltransferase, TrmH family n=1 Tax=Oryzisolibacter propanilivorax TaxID=1527607 RepID=A0A1G9SPI9_9BURK|nr:RNA methyltransferase [Oryzisolibacter propanilivorax]SDM37341.1 RNA methyltransferase, TrmH family [Oryzisolibacter propanilivorax]
MPAPSIPAPTFIESASNALVKELRRLAHDSTGYRKAGRVWVEGEHLCSAALARGQRPALAVFSESFWPQAPAEYRQAATKNVVLADALWAAITALESPAHLGFVLELAHGQSLVPDAPTVVLDRLQDAGNVGSIVRSAAAFGFTQIAAVRGTAALWSPKVLRAGMGAHFALRVVEGLDAAALIESLRLPLLVTSSHQGDWLHRATLPWPCAWVLGHEGQGVSPALEQAASQRIRIMQPGGEESLNVAAAAAICLHASAAAAA